MRKDIIIVDWLLLIAFLFIIITKITNIPGNNIAQPIFFALIIIHIIQHLKIYTMSLKKTKSTK